MKTRKLTKQEKTVLAQKRKAPPFSSKQIVIYSFLICVILFLAIRLFGDGRLFGGTYISLFQCCVAALISCLITDALIRVLRYLAFVRKLDNVECIDAILHTSFPTCYTFVEVNEGRTLFKLHIDEWVNPPIGSEFLLYSFDHFKTEQGMGALLKSDESLATQGKCYAKFWRLSNQDSFR